MVRRKSLTLAQARKSLRAFYAQKAGKRRGCGSGSHKRRNSKRRNSKRRSSRRGGAAGKEEEKGLLGHLTGAVHGVTSGVTGAVGAVGKGAVGAVGSVASTVTKPFRGGRKRNKRGGRIVSPQRAREKRYLQSYQPDADDIKLKKDAIKGIRTNKAKGLNQADSLNRMTKHHDESDTRVYQGHMDDLTRMQRDMSVRGGPNTVATMGQKKMVRDLAKEGFKVMNKFGVTPRGSFEVGGRRKRKNSKRRRGSHGKKKK